MGLIEKLAEDIGRIANALEAFNLQGSGATGTGAAAGDDGTVLQPPVTEAPVTETPPTAAEAVAGDAAAQEAAAAEVSKDDVETALRGFLSTSGRDAAREMLGKFGAESLGTLKPEQYAEFIAAIKAYK